MPIPKERFDVADWYDKDDHKAGKSRAAKAALMEGYVLPLYLCIYPSVSPHQSGGHVLPLYPLISLEGMDAKPQQHLFSH